MFVLDRVIVVIIGIARGGDVDDGANDVSVDGANDVCVDGANDVSVDGANDVIDGIDTRGEANDVNGGGEYIIVDSGMIVG